MGEAVPVLTDLSDVYWPEVLEDAKKRCDELATKFESIFGSPPELFARAPGRVNLIGEHIDYEGFAVFPMAIRWDTVIAIRASKEFKLTIANVDAQKYEKTIFEADPSQAVNTNEHTWANYFLAAYKGVFEYLESRQLKRSPCGLDVLVDGQVPTGSGLSSSSAFVCASFLAIMGVHGLCAPKEHVAEFTCTCERHVGTQSGGMDQAISIMAKTGVAKLVEFNPVRATDVILPSGATFVVANSLAVSNKAVTADQRYNLRVVECQLATLVLAHSLGADHIEKYETLDQIVDLLNSREITDGRAYITKHLHGGPYAAEEITEIIGKSVGSFLSASPSKLRVLDKASAGEGFHLRDRALHVLEESGRVHAFKSTCESDLGAVEKLTKLGQLMTESHSSCRDLYDCSCPEIEELVSLSKAAGSYGTRLTGAGWGGCTVSLVRDVDVDNFIKHIRSTFYERHIENKTISEDELSKNLFATKPSSGAAILKLHNP